jgi:hypothetical protein
MKIENYPNIRKEEMFSGNTWVLVMEKFTAVA